MGNQRITVHVVVEVEIVPSKFDVSTGTAAACAQERVKNAVRSINADIVPEKTEVIGVHHIPLGWCETCFQNPTGPFHEYAPRINPRGPGVNTPTPKLVGYRTEKRGESEYRIPVYEYSPDCGRDGEAGERLCGVPHCHRHGVKAS